MQIDAEEAGCVLNVTGLRMLPKENLLEYFSHSAFCVIFSTVKDTLFGDTVLVHQGLIFHIWGEEENTRENIKGQIHSSNKAAMLSIMSVFFALIQTELKEHEVRFIIFKMIYFPPVFELELAVFKGLLNTYTTLIIEDTWVF